MRCGPNLPAVLMEEKGEPAGAVQLFDPGEVTMTPAAVDDMRFLDLHPGELLSRHVCGRWIWDHLSVIQKNRDNLERGLTTVDSIAKWKKQSEVKKHKWFLFNFYIHTESGHTHIYTDLDVDVHESVL